MVLHSIISSCVQEKCGRRWEDQREREAEGESIDGPRYTGDSDRSWWLELTAEFVRAPFAALLNIDFYPPLIPKNCYLSRRRRIF